MNWWDYLLTGLSVLCTAFSILGAYKSNEYAEKIKNSINKIRDSLPPDDCKEIFDLLNSGENRVERYFDSLIAGTAFPDQKFMLDEQFYTCQTAVHNMQLLLKEKLDSTGEKLK